MCTPGHRARLPAFDYFANLSMRQNLVLLWAGLAGLCHLPCLAGAFSVTPVRLFFEPRDRAVAVTLVNEGPTGMALQADVYQWRQDASGADQLVPTDDMIVSPPSLKLPPYTRQVIRLALLVPKNQERQMSYRLLVREVPEVPTGTDKGVQLPIALVLNMPVFVTPAGAQKRLDCKLAHTDKGQMAASCQNTGTAYTQVREARLQRNGQWLASFEGNTYLLPGTHKTLPVKPPEMAFPTPGQAELELVLDDLRPHRQDVHVP